jgi:hypothetical protein
MCVLNAYLILAENLLESGHLGDRVKEVERWYEHGSVVDLQDGGAWDLLKIVFYGIQSLFPPDKNKSF